MKKIFLAVSLFAMIFVLSGCSFPGTSSKVAGSSILKSLDGGKTFVPKVTIDAKTTIAPANIVSFVFETGNSNRITIGTQENGIFVTENGGDAWRKLVFPPTKTYGLVSDWSEPARLYATGEMQGRGKIYRSEDRGAKWDEIYVEPNNGTVVTALVQSLKNPQILYAGTSTGVIIRTIDGGSTWKNLKGVGSPILSMVFDPAGDTLYLFLSGKGLFRSQDGGENFVPLPEEKLADTSRRSIPVPGSSGISGSNSSVTSFVVDSSHSGSLLIGTGSGLFRSSDFGSSWSELNIIGSSKKYPIRGVAINPKNSNEIFYSAAFAIYKSIDGGVNWSVYQLNSSRSAGMIKYDPVDSSKIYLGFRTFSK